MSKNQDIQSNKFNHTASDSMIEAIQNAGVECIFVNLGSDHPAIIESFAKASAKGKPIPKIVVCPHEMVALSAAHGYAQLTGKPQAVVVHVDVGTQNLGGSIHNAMRGRVPVLIFSGASPVTQEGELKGGRNEYIHYLQDVPDQRAIVRQYTKWDYDLHTGQNIQQVTLRALQLAQSEPKGPVYLMSPREMLEEETPDKQVDPRKFAPIAPNAASPDNIKEIVEALRHAEKPLIITSYLGRNAKAVDELVKLSERLAIPVMEAGPYYVNFPADHPLHAGFEDYFGVNERVIESDVIVVIDSDEPWIPLKTQPNDNAKVFWVDIDPLKENIPLWYFPVDTTIKANSYEVLKQINALLDSETVPHGSFYDLSVSIEKQKLIQNRYESLRLAHEQRISEQSELEKGREDIITPEFLVGQLRELIDDDTIIVNESISNFGVVWRHIRRNKPGQLIGSGASSLGWHGGAAIGAKLANPDKTVVALTGDGTFIFSVPTAVYWTAKRHNAPFLTIVFNNSGWHSPKLSTLGVHPDGVANEYDKFWVNFDPTVEYDKVAEASGGALAIKVVDPKDVRNALIRGLEAVKNGQSAVINAVIAPISKQQFN